MAPSSPLRSKALHHGRSLSLPSASHPALSHFDENLRRLRSSQGACSSLSSTNARINGLKSIYESIDDLLVFQHNISEKCVDDCISLLDAFTPVKDLISLLKQNLRELLSVVRRKDVNGINGYLSSKRNSKQMIHKSLKNLRGSASSASSEDASEDMTVVSMLKEAESVAISLLESVLSYVLGSKKCSWSLVSKLMHSKKASDDENEFNKLDSLLQLNQENELMNRIKEMDSSIEVLEEDLEYIFRQLIKARVSLLRSQQLVSNLMLRLKIL